MALYVGSQILLLAAAMPLDIASQHANATSPFVIGRLISLGNEHGLSEPSADSWGPILRSPDHDGLQGRSCSQRICLISADNDFEAIGAYLHRFRNSKKTCRSYEKELSRFLLWCVSYRRIAMSSIRTNDCEAYKDFLASPDPDWIGPKVGRASPLWRPFEGPLSPKSQRYAVQVLRNFFSWLGGVGYLFGNPWITVDDPQVEQTDVPMQIDKALPAKLWDRLSKADGILDRACQAAGASTANAKQLRLARAIILLMGCTGARRQEVANAQRNFLTPVPGTKGGLWELKVLGKRNKWRALFLPLRVVEAIRAHWEDRGENFSKSSTTPLFSPLVIPATETSRRKHTASPPIDKHSSSQPFSADGIYQVVKTCLLRMASDPTLRLTKRDRDLLRSSAPHAFRHTFATQAVANEMPIDVLQRLMGHVSQATTSIYVQAERSRTIKAARALFSR